LSFTQSQPAANGYIKIIQNQLKTTKKDPQWFSLNLSHGEVRSVENESGHERPENSIVHSQIFVRKIAYCLTPRLASIVRAPANVATKTFVPKWLAESLSLKIK
jgi:hypothetical protein